MLRGQMYLSDDTFVLPPGMYDELRRPVKNKLRDLYETDSFILTCNPYVRCIVRRTRDFLENTINPSQ